MDWLIEVTEDPSHFPCIEFQKCLTIQRYFAHMGDWNQQLLVKKKSLVVKKCIILEIFSRHVKVLFLYMVVHKMMSTWYVRSKVDLAV